MVISHKMYGLNRRKVVTVFAMSKMPLPMLNRVCGCVPIRAGCNALTVTSLMACVITIAVAAGELPQHASRMPEDNLISMITIMFAALSAISNIVILLGIALRRPGFLQFSILFNSLFVVFIFLLAVVTCLFSPEFQPYLTSAGNITLIVLALFFGAGYCFYYLLVVNSYYRHMKIDGGSAIPV